MEMPQTSKRIHPLMAGAAASVMLVSLLGAAAIVGIIPTSQGTVSDKATQMPPSAQAIVPASAPSAAPALPASALAEAPQPAAAPVAKAEPKEVVRHKTIVHHKYVQQAAPTRTQPVQVAQAEPQRTYSPAPVYQPVQQPVQQPAPAAQNSPIGIGVGAVVGGLIGNQIGGGSGRTLATVAGAVGGGYIGNEIAKRNP